QPEHGRCRPAMKDRQMPNLSNIRNSGVFIAGDKNKVTVGKQGGATDAELLEEINELLIELLKGVRQLPTEQRAYVRAEIMEVQGELEEPSPDKAKISRALDKLRPALSVAAPLLEIAQDITHLVTELAH
ncbi:MAG: hypothetical protein ACRDN0_15265, partial [Trebonia sp.]